METPERNQIGTPVSKFEDSPVFNYISSLSPIKPVKSLRIAQTFNSLSFGSPPSVFTSPHISSHKESRFLRRHQDSDPSKSDISCENGTNVSTNEGVVMDDTQTVDNSVEHQENFDPGVSIGETSVDLPVEHSKFAIELPCALQYNCGSPNCGPAPCSTDTKCLSELTDASASQVQKAFETGSSGSAMHLHGVCQIEQKKEETTCDWENLISDVDDLLFFNSPNNTDAFKGLSEKAMDPGTRFGTSIMSKFPRDDINNLKKMLLVNQEPCDELHHSDDPSTQPGEASGLEEIEQIDDLASTNLNNTMGSNLNEKTDNETDFGLHRGVRRRCLDFEMVGARRKNLHNVSNCSSSISLHSDEKIASNDNQLVPIKTGRDSSRCILPGIGLHLNALASSSKEYKSLKHETLSSKRQLIILPCSPSDFHSPPDGQEPFRKSLTSASSERDTDPAENGVQLAEDVSQLSSYLVAEDFNQNSPKKKRRRMEQDGESGSCKRCNCKKSKCLKLYCECFAAGVYCIEPCSCQDCFNKPIHEDTVLATRKQIESRNPLAFAPKVIKNADSVVELGNEPTETPASARHKRGCNCKKSSCLKKYCECYQGGVGCSINCRCEGCKNAFGRKDGSGFIEPEDADTSENTMTDNVMQKSEIQNTEPATPLQLCRPMAPLPFHLMTKPPQSTLGRPNILQPQSKFDKHYETVAEDEMPEFLQANCSSPTTGIKTVSPNSKRVSSPQCNFGSSSSPGRRRSRKLILQSIPSLPSLTPHH